MNQVLDDLGLVSTQLNGGKSQGIGTVLECLTDKTEEEL